MSYVCIALTILLGAIGIASLIMAIPFVLFAVIMLYLCERVAGLDADIPKM